MVHIVLVRSIQMHLPLVLLPPPLLFCYATCRNLMTKGYVPWRELPRMLQRAMESRQPTAAAAAAGAQPIHAAVQTQLAAQQAQGKSPDPATATQEHGC
jgi:hypothetical protein